VMDIAILKPTLAELDNNISAGNHLAEMDLSLGSRKNQPHLWSVTILSS
jgi:hypothetical protein